MASDIWKSLTGLFGILGKGGPQLQELFEKISKAIVDWFLKKGKQIDELIDKIKEKIKKYLKKSRFPIYKTTKMLSKYKGEELGIELFNYSKVKYLTEAERLEYELAIVDGKLFTKNGKPFDTTFGGTLKQVEGKAIFVMDKEGRIFASNNYPRGVFHHSSFFGGEAVAAAGEIKVTKGVIELVTKQSGHYQPTKKYLLQFMHNLEKNGIDVNKIFVEF